MTEQKPCTSTAMNCVALCQPGRSVCTAHAVDRNLKPQAYKGDYVKKHWPPTPWDDEIPWYEDKR